MLRVLRRGIELTSGAARLRVIMRLIHYVYYILLPIYYTLYLYNIYIYIYIYIYITARVQLSAASLLRRCGLWAFLCVRRVEQRLACRESSTVQHFSRCCCCSFRFGLCFHGRNWRFGSVRFLGFGNIKRFGSVRFLEFGNIQRFASVRFLYFIGSVRFGSVRFLTPFCRWHHRRSGGGWGQLPCGLAERGVAEAASTPLPNTYIYIYMYTHM